MDRVLNEQGKTFNYHISETLEDLFVREADVPKECIKSIEINRVD